jgi:protoporphyrinogen oxidase
MNKLINDVVIIGAGPAGLTAGYQLTKSQKSVTILEMDPHLVGGISRTEKYKDFLFDIGGHRFFSKSKEVIDLWKEILPDGFIDRPRLSRIYYGNKYYSYPLKPIEALTNLGFYTSLLCVISYLWAKITPIKNPTTFHQWVRNQFGEKLFLIFFKTYTEKVWGMSCDEISADWAAQRIKGLSLGNAIWHSIVKSLKPAGSKNTKKPVIKTLIDTFKYPRLGPGMLWEAAANKIKAQGGHVEMGARVQKCIWSASNEIWTVTTLSTKGGEKEYFAKHLISSAPLNELSKQIHPPLASSSSGNALKYRDFITVALIAKHSQDFPDNWIYIHDPSVKVGRVQNFKSWSPEMVPNKELTCLGLEYFCFEGDGLWNMKDHDLIVLATKEIEKIGLIKPNQVIDGVVVRQPKAYPVYDDQYKENVAKIRDEIEKKFPTLHLVGRNGMHKYNNQDHAMMTAMLTAENILLGKRKFDVWNVNEDAEYHESGFEGANNALASERLVPQKLK